MRGVGSVFQRALSAPRYVLRRRDDRERVMSDLFTTAGDTAPLATARARRMLRVRLPSTRCPFRCVVRASFETIVSMHQIDRCFVSKSPGPAGRSEFAVSATPAAASSAAGPAGPAGPFLEVTVVHNLTIPAGPGAVAASLPPSAPPRADHDLAGVSARSPRALFTL